jgi:hypothetical protein
MPMSATINEPVPLTCQLRNTMQRSVVSQVNSIYADISPLSVLSAWVGLESAAYVHVALVAMVHAGHVVIHVAVVHVRVIHDKCVITVLCERKRGGFVKVVCEGGS